MAADVRAKALAYIREGRVLVTTVATPPDARYPCLVVATVQGHMQRYQVVRHPESGWSCDCWRTEPCAHLAAVAISCGAPGYAARTPTRPENRENT
ncbi:hypothetical protein [Microtetraspora glauca]|uniref:SWIM-type domain-containing protein n=1 Tax=Microtetraspora glauca TaxID=1996 RepID=A0ABV3GA22_MICGL